MLAFLGFLTIIGLLVLILTKKASVHFCLVVLPAVAALVAGFGLGDIGDFMADGLIKIAPTGIMLAFAAMFFGLMYDAGMFDPMIRGVVNVAGGDPLKVCIGTFLIASLAHLDGSGASTYLIAVSALLPVYKALKMSPYTLATIAALSAGVMNIVPWGGPTMRVATVLDMDVVDLFVPMLPTMAAGMLWVLFVSVYLGLNERKRVGVTKQLPAELNEPSAEAALHKRPKMMVPNFILTVLAIYCLVMKVLPMSAVFVVAFVLGLFINYPNPAMQRERIESQAKTVINVVTIIFCAGIFTGLLTATGMIGAMSMALASIIPTSLGAFVAPVISLVSMPATIFFDADSMYYGVFPVIAGALEAFGISGAGIGRAFLLGGHTVASGFTPVNGATWVLVGLAGVDIGTHQKKSILWAFGATGVMLVVAMATGLLR